jgi:hypothetical protein
VSLCIIFVVVMDWVLAKVIPRHHAQSFCTQQAKDALVKVEQKEMLMQNRRLLVGHNILRNPSPLLSNDTIT